MKKNPTMSEPVIHAMQVEGDLRRSQRIPNAFTKRITMRRGGQERRVSFHYVGSNLPRVRAIKQWRITLCTPRGNDKGKDEIHLQCVPDLSQGPAETDNYFLDEDMKVAFYKKTLKGGRSAQQTCRRSMASGVRSAAAMAAVR